jgi:hypothetical protein
MKYVPPHQASNFYTEKCWPNSIWKGPLLDFRNVLYIIWQEILRLNPTPVQFDIAHFLQYGPDPSIAPNEGQNSKLLLEAQRGEGKSWIGAAFAMWFLGLDPKKHEVLVISAGKQKADNFSTFCHRVIQEVSIFQPLVPDKAQRWSMVSFDVKGHGASQVASCSSIGIFGQTTGSRADLILADDIEVPNTAETALQREKLKQRRSEFDFILKPGGRDITLGTPHTESTIYNTLLAHKRLWPARYPTNEWLAKYGRDLSPFLANKKNVFKEHDTLVGTPTDPKRFTDLDLKEREASAGRSNFNLQMMLDTRPSDAERRPLRVRDLVVDYVDKELGPGKLVWGPSKHTEIPDQSRGDGLPLLAPDGDRFYRPVNFSTDESEGEQRYKYESKILAIDPAGRGKDEIAWCIVFSLHGNLFVPLLKGMSGGYEDSILQEIASDAKKYKVSTILVEDNFGDGMFNALLAPHVRGYSIEGVRHSKQKEKRILDVIEPLMNQHKLVIDPGVILSDYESITKKDVTNRTEYSLIHQMTRCTRDRGCLKHDDRLDVLSIGCAYFKESVSRSADESEKIQRDREMDQEINDFLDGFPNSNQRRWGGTNAAMKR